MKLRIVKFRLWILSMLMLVSNILSKTINCQGRGYFVQFWSTKLQNNCLLTEYSILQRLQFSRFWDSRKYLLILIFLKIIFRSQRVFERRSSWKIKVFAKFRKNRSERGSWTKAKGLDQPIIIINNFFNFNSHTVGMNSWNILEI